MILVILSTIGENVQKNHSIWDEYVLLIFFQPWKSQRSWISKVCFFVFSIRWNGPIFSGRCERKGAFWSRRYLKSLQNRDRFGATPRFQSMFFLVLRRYLGSRGSCLFQAVTDFCLSIENITPHGRHYEIEQITFQGENRKFQASRFAPEACKVLLWMKFAPEAA